MVVLVNSVGVLTQSEWLSIIAAEADYLPKCCSQVEEFRLTIGVLYADGFNTPFDCKTYLYRYLEFKKRHWMPHRVQERLDTLAIECRGRIRDD